MEAMDCMISRQLHNGSSCSAISLQQSQSYSTLPGSRQHQQRLSPWKRAFLTQPSFYSTTTSGGAGGCPATVANGGDESDEEVNEYRRMMGEEATVDQARRRMATARREREAETAKLAGFGAESETLRAYSRQRFLRTMESAPPQGRTPPQTAAMNPTHFPYSTCATSAYITVPDPVSIGAATDSRNQQFSGQKHGACRDELLSAGRQRAQLMSRLRMRQPELPVRFRHDGTAQELVQEGGLPSRSVCEAFPWKSSYKYTPFPTPKLAAWSREDAERRKERVRLADEFDNFDLGTNAEREYEREKLRNDSPPTPPTSPPLIELTVPAAARDTHLAPENNISEGNAEEPKIQLTVASQPAAKQPSGQQHHRPRSGRGKAGKRHGSHQLTPEQQQKMLEQQQAEKAAARRRNFSVSTIGEDELPTHRQEQQRLQDVCQRLLDRRAAREAAAAAAAEAQRQAEAALKAAMEPAPPPTPTPPQTPTKTAEKGKKKAQPSKKASKSGKGKSASSRSSSRASSTEKSDDGKKKKKRQGSAKSAGSDDSQKSAPSAASKSSAVGAKKKKPAAAKEKEKKPSTGKKAPAAGKKKPGSPAAGKRGRKTSQQAKSQEVPPQPEQPAESKPVVEGPDPIDLLADEIEVASVFYRTKAPGELPDYPCPSSGEKSRQQLTKLWWQQQALQGMASSAAGSGLTLIV